MVLWQLWNFAVEIAIVIWGIFLTMVLRKKEEIDIALIVLVLIYKKVRIWSDNRRQTNHFL